MSSEPHTTLGMQTNPFPAGPCKEHYYKNASHKQILEEVLYGITARKGILVVVGKEGVGKTSLLLQLQPALEREGIRTAWVFNAIDNKIELLEAIVHGFDLNVPEAPHIAELVERLHRFFLHSHKEGKHCAIVIDEAHLLDLQTMEVLRMLSNLEVGGERLVQILLVGKSELRQKFERPQLREYRNRIGLFHELHPLPPRDLKEYVDFKLSRAGSSLQLETRGRNLLNKLSGGNYRLINLIMDKTLQIMATSDNTGIGAKSIAEGSRMIAARDRGLARKLLHLQLVRVTVFLGVLLLGGLAVSLAVFFTEPWKKTELVENTPSVNEEVFLPDERTAAAVSPRENGERDARLSEMEPTGGDALQRAEKDNVDGLSDSRDALENNAPKQQDALAELSRLAQAAQAFLVPWGLEELRDALYDAVKHNNPEIFSRALSAMKTDDAAALVMVPLQQPPPEAGAETFSKFHWQQFGEFGPSWLVLWRPPYVLPDYAMEERSRGVVKLQERLDLLGYYRQGIDGKVGVGTWKAVERFQADHGLPVTGVPDAATVFLLEHASKPQQ